MANADKKSNPAQISQAVLDVENQAIKVNVVAGGGDASTDVDLTKVGGNTVAVNTGAADSGTQRVVLASDQTTIPVDIQDTSIAVDIDSTTDSITVYAPDNNTTPLPVSGSVSVSNFSAISGLSIPAHDYISLSYTAGNLTGVVYRTGGSGGTIVGTLTLAYSGSDLISVTKS